MLLEISQNSRENTCTRVSFLIKLQATLTTFSYKLLLTNSFIRGVYPAVETYYFPITLKDCLSHKLLLNFIRFLPNEKCFFFPNTTVTRKGGGEGAGSSPYHDLRFRTIFWLMKTVNLYGFLQNQNLISFYESI